MSPLLLFHIITATIGLTAGVTAMCLRKGSPVHRRAGIVFSIAMLSMSASGAVLAELKTQTINVLVGLLTFYLVATAWLSGRRVQTAARSVDWAALLFGSVVGASLVTCGVQAANSPTGLKDGDEAGAYFTFGAIALLAAALDVRMIVSGVQGKHRVARHLWRMLFPMLIAVVSVVPRLSRLFPAVFGSTIMMYTPIVIVFVTLIYWLVRVLFTGAFRKLAFAAKSPVR